jgi:hypothetical protein
MASRYAALCDDFYINTRLNLKMDLPLRRDTVLSLFDRLRRQRPDLERFRRFSNELALESHVDDSGSYQWLAVRRTSVRSGSVNPESDSRAHDLHRLVLETAPYFLDIPPIDIENIEVLFGFDLLSPGNHDAIVYAALTGDSPLAELCAGPSGRHAAPVEFAPSLGIALDDSSTLRAFFEVKTRSSPRASAGRDASSAREAGQPISVYVLLRKHAPFADLAEIPGTYHSLVARLEELLDDRIVPKMLRPLKDAIAAA